MFMLVNREIMSFTLKSVSINHSIYFHEINNQPNMDDLYNLLRALT